MDTDRAARDAALQRLAPLLGEWSIELSFPGVLAGDVRGRAVFEWMLGGQFLSQRSGVEHPDAPDGFCIVDVDPGGESYTQHYFDSRGVVRVYAMTFRDGVWTLLRDAPDFSPLSFSQRFTGTLSDDGTAIHGRWETSSDGANWELDFEGVYTRLA